MTDMHEHVYKELKLFPIKRVHKNYPGTPGDMAFITRQCACKKVVAIDYGKTEDMEIKFKELEAL